MQVTGTQIPSKGDQVEQRRLGVVRRGYVWYADQLQVLVKWEDGKSSSLRLGSDLHFVATAAVDTLRCEDESAEAALLGLAAASAELPRGANHARRRAFPRDHVPAGAPGIDPGTSRV
jgi:hypothetical protein